jgi:hypothetical protein
MKGRGPAWFGAWLVVGAALTFCFLAALSVGPFVLPFALVLLAIVATRSPRLPEAVGFISGIGVMLLVIAFLHRSDGQPCPAGDGFQQLAPGQQSVSCGGLDPHPWLYLGIPVTAAGAVTYLAVSRKRR